MWYTCVWINGWSPLQFQDEDCGMEFLFDTDLRKKRVCASDSENRFERFAFFGRAE